MTKADGGTWQAERWVLRHLYWLIVLIGAMRLLQGAFTQLAPDEAVYWMWSRHLAGGYFDHPPMIAVLNWLSTHVLGDREIAVRLPAVLLSMGTLLLIVRAARIVLRDQLAVAAVATVWVCSPMLAGFGLIFTPDTPAIFFTAAALAFALGAARGMDLGDGGIPQLRWGRGAGGSAGGRFWAWVGFGVCCGLGLDSKYPVVLLPAAVGISLLCSRKGWRELGRPGPWAAAVIAVLIFSPVIWWNAQHHWASFLFQLNHGVNGSGGHRTVGHVLGAIVLGLGGFVGGQALLWTPVLLGVSAVVLWKYGRAFRRLGEVDRMLWLAGALPLVVFGLAAMKAGRGEINWPALAYVPVSLLLGRWVAGGMSGSAPPATEQMRAGGVAGSAPPPTEEMRAGGMPGSATPATGEILARGMPGSAPPATGDVQSLRLGWMRVGWQVALAFTIVVELMSAPIILPALLRLGVPMPGSMAELTGWPAWGKALAASADGAMVVCNRHQDASEATFYMPGKPNAWCDGIGSRPTCYAYFDDHPDFAKLNRVLYMGGHLNLFMAKYGYTHSEPRPLPIDGDKRKTHVASMVWR